MTSLYRFLPHLGSFMESLTSQTLYPDLELNLRVVQPSPSELRALEAAIRPLQCQVSLTIAENHETLYQTWNQILSSASGDFIAIWNVDDRRTPTSLQDQLKEHVKDSAVCGVYGPFAVVANPAEIEGPVPDQAEAQDMRLRREMHLGPFFSFRRDALDHLWGFDEQLTIAGDFDFAIRLHAFGKLIRTNHLLGYFLDAGRGLSTRSSWRRRTEVGFVVNRYGNLSSQLRAHLYRPGLSCRSITVKGRPEVVPAW